MQNKFFLVVVLISLSLILALDGCKNTSYKKTISKDKISIKSSKNSIKKITASKSISEIKQNLVEYKGDIYHVFFHCLIAFPKRAGKINGDFLDSSRVTVNEFKRCLSEFYKKNYVLVDINSIFNETEENGRQIVKRAKIMLPVGKMPLVISIDDVSYSDTTKEFGMIDKIILDKNNNLKSYTQIGSKEVISDDNEVIPILEKFVANHPDFSFNNAKATLAFTGWKGILGYSINHDNKNYIKEVKSVKPILKKLKENGWSFASHSYGHRGSAKVSYNIFAEDTEKWSNEIESVTGPTKIFIYPFGEELAPNTDKYKLLLNNGFRLFCGVNMEPEWQDRGNSIHMGRVCIDGMTLKSYPEKLNPFINSFTVWDSKERGPI